MQYKAQNLHKQSVRQDSEEPEEPNRALCRLLTGRVPFTVVFKCVFRFLSLLATLVLTQIISICSKKKNGRKSYNRSILSCPRHILIKETLGVWRH